MNDWLQEILDITFTRIRRDTEGRPVWCNCNEELDIIFYKMKIT